MMGVTWLLQFGGMSSISGVGGGGGVGNKLCKCNTCNEVTVVSFPYDGLLYAKIRSYITYLLQIEFDVRTVSYGPKCEARAINQRGRKKRGSLTYSTGRENEVSKIFIISLRLIGRGKGNFSNLVGRTVKYGAQNWPITEHRAYTY